MNRSTLLEPSGLAPTDDPFDSSFNRLIDSFFRGNHPLFCPAERVWNPATDIFETKDSLYIKMEVAGVLDKDLHLKSSGNFLIVKGRRQDEHHAKKENFHLMEIHYGSFERVFRFPSAVDASTIQATLRNGFLLVTIPKTAELQNVRIEIE
jgi:HSP20 family protein